MQTSFCFALFQLFVCLHLHKIFALSATSLGNSLSVQNEILQRNCSFVQGLHANLIRFITKEGFHRDLEDTVEVTVTSSVIPFNNFADGECLFAILAKFTPDLFVDPYEVTQMPELKDYLRVLNNWTDLESPAWLAKSNSTVFIQLQALPTGNLISTVEVKMPIHFRYQKPLSHSRLKNRLYSSRGASGVINPGGYVPVSIPLPKLLLRCQNWNHELVEEQCHMIQTLCSSISSMDDNCLWISLPFKSNSKGSTVYIPVGDADSKMLITCVTILVVLGGTIFIAITLIRAKARLIVESESTEPHPHRD